MEDPDGDRNGGQAHGRSLARRAGELARQVRAHIGLGANLGDAATTLGAAIHALAALPGARLDGVSRLYATATVGPPDQPEFRNAVVALDVPAGPDPATGAFALLASLKQLERAFGRTPRERWGPRELDLDLLLFGQARLDLERPPEAASIDAAAGRADGDTPSWLIVPHPELRERLFVLAPLADLAPALRPPGWSETVGAACGRRRSVEGPSAALPMATWDSVHGEWRPDRVMILGQSVRRGHLKRTAAPSE